MITQAFAATTVPIDRSMTAIEALLEQHGVTDQRYTHSKPRSDDPDSPDSIGRIVYEFVWVSNDRRGVRLVVTYQPVILKRRGRYGEKKPAKGVTPAMAARALFWLLKAKFDAIDFGIEEFEVAFMPHLVTELGFTFAEHPQLIGAALAEPEDMRSTLALSAPRG